MGAPPASKRSSLQAVTPRAAEPAMPGLRIRVARPGEAAQLEPLQRRASLGNPGDRDALLAHPDAIHLPPDQVAAGHVAVLEAGAQLLEFAAWLAP